MFSKKLIAYVLPALFVFSVALPAFGVTLNNPVDSPDIKSLLEKIFNAVSVIAGSLAAIMFAIAGILYLTSAGSQERMTSAKKAMIYAITGLIVAVLAKTISITIQEIIGVKQ